MDLDRFYGVESWPCNYCFDNLDFEITDPEGKQEGGPYDLSSVRHGTDRRQTPFTHSASEEVRLELGRASIADMR